MSNAFTKDATFAGFAAGLATAACCSLLLWLNHGRNEMVVTVIDFLAGLPVVFARKLDIPQPLFYLLFFTYWGLNGATIARLLRRWCVSR